jgi:hypothetical protein
MPTDPPDDTLATLLRRAIGRTTDPLVRGWLLGLLESGEAARASEAKTHPLVPHADGSRTVADHPAPLIRRTQEGQG